MSEDKTKQGHGLNVVEELAARWDKASYRAQGSPFEDLSVSALAKNTGTRAWSRVGGSVKGDTIARYIYLSFEELIEVEKLDLRAATQLLEICEATFLFEEECNELGSFEGIDGQAYQQRMRFVEEFGLYQDYPVALANLDVDLRELCAAEEIITFVDLMEFLDRLSDKAWIGGSYRNLQNVFAHGDEKGLTRFFPYRLGHRGFHLPEALSFILNRIKQHELNSVFEYHERRRKRTRLSSKRMEMPSVVENRLMPEVIKCLHYFCSHQPRLLIRLHDSAYLCRELMYLNDPQTEGVLHWLIHLTLGIFRPPQEADIDEELKKLTIPQDSALLKDLSDLLKEEAG
ncbi:hypothetical protein QEH59_13025 [Coraliomargarita sp. SDUM461004]|uniref:Uncharacterized protein n=1 Tax=Thalassobacterium sedimentorum TaxID=3041258 RepID=A0ABU1AP18_9BACT|nr:hypothetical protein [Coraliomargarita sp. SDUM461004]MDQ8195353.1 hypothetical protein [Coraliomargarita sp. SDUM461004]